MMGKKLAIGDLNLTVAVKIEDVEELKNSVHPDVAHGGQVIIILPNGKQIVLNIEQLNDVNWFNDEGE